MCGLARTPEARPETKSQVCTCHPTRFYAVFGQVTIEYHVDRGALQPVRVHTIVISAQHSPDVSLDQVRVLAESVKTHDSLTGTR